MPRTKVNRSVEATQNLMEAVNTLAIGRKALRAAQQAERESAAVLASRLEENRGQLANLVAVPSFARMLYVNGDKRHWTSAPCYSLFDEVREPRAIDGFTIGQISTESDRKVLLVTAPDRDFGYDIPLENIISIQIIDEQAAAK